MTMLAAVYHGPLDLRVEPREVPSIADDELLLRVECASICATDLRIIQGSHRKFVPGTVRVPGHEIVGTLERVGSKVDGYCVGERVFIAPNIGCGHCRQCRAGLNNLCPDYDAFGITLDGGFAQYMRITAPAIEQGNVILVDQTADAATMALAEPFSCVMHGQERISVGANDTILIEGAGPIGIMHLLLARLRGARRIIVSDLSKHRLERASALGADRVIDLTQQNLTEIVMNETGKAGPDVVIVAAASPAAFEAAVSLAAVGGRINFFAGLPKERPTIDLDANLVHYKELIVTGSTGCSTSDCRKAAKLVASGQIDLRPLIGERFPLLEAKAAIEVAKGQHGLKVILEPGSGAAGER
jgi:L-iditol 2-dehydrogenase